MFPAQDRNLGGRWLRWGPRRLVGDNNVRMGSILQADSVCLCDCAMNPQIDVECLWLSSEPSIQRKLLEKQW